MERHTKWEEELEALIAAKFKHLVDTIGDLRTKVAEDLETSPEMTKHRMNLGKHLTEVKEETKKVLQRLHDLWEDRWGEMDEDFADKAPAWAQMVQDIQWRFTKYSDDINGEISSSVVKWMNEESELLRSATEEVTALVDKAQTELISDYAWLNDVTYRDWERYHQLMFRGREAGEQFQKLVNGEITSTLSNPVHDMLGRIQAEIGEVTEKFDAGLEKIRHQGWKYLLGNKIDQKPNNKGKGKEKGREKAKADDPQVSILPVEREEMDFINGEGFIGKSKEQVEQAILQAEGQGIRDEL
ncbi:hypothetical protein FRC17_007278 [Serendipita sp. 399]|nr:hypothetical protein FRC17_007278 [Serendipita sp. 399]